MLKIFLLVVLVINSQITYAQLTPESVTSSQGNIGFYQFKPSGYKADSTYSYPLLIFLHGIGERGNGSSELPMALNSSFAKLLVKGATMTFLVNGKQHAFLVLIPQMSKNYVNWQNFYVDAMIDYAKSNLKIDTNKIFVSGWSLGGGGAWKYATSSVEHAHKLAGIIPVSPAPDYTDLCNLARAQVAVWAHHAIDDASVPLHYTEDAITAINACSPVIPAIITYYPFGGHPYVADHAYDTLNELSYPNVFQWMIGTSRFNNLRNNLAPVANGGNDTVVILSSTTTILNGKASYDPNDVIVSYRWSVLSGPPSPELVIHQPQFPLTKVSGLEPGEYVFNLLVRDQFNVERSDKVSVKIVLPSNGKNALPVVNAGPDLTTNNDSYYVKAVARDYDGTIKKFQWRQISGPGFLTIEGTGNTASLWGISNEGTYGVELSVYDNHRPAGIGKDTVFITRNPSPAVYYNFISDKNPVDMTNGLVRNGAILFFLMCVSMPGMISGFNTIKKLSLIKVYIIF